MPEMDTGQTAQIAVMERGKTALIQGPREDDKSKITLVKAKGSLVWDDAGREYLSGNGAEAGVQ